MVKDIRKSEGNGGMTDSQKAYVDRVARDFGFESFEDLAVSLGYTSSQQLAAEHGFSNAYDYFTKPGHVGRYLNLEVRLTG